MNRTRNAKNFLRHNFLHHEIANRLLENLDLLGRKFEVILEIGSKDGYLSSIINEQLNPSLIFQTENYCDHNTQIVADDEHLPFKAASFDLIVSNLNLHFINEVPQFLLQVNKLLKPGGIFIASFFGEENLHELAKVLYESENEIYGRVSPRMPPTIDVKTAANLLNKAGFKNPISDVEKITISYKDPVNLLQDLKMMGQGNILFKRSRTFFSKKLLNKITENYQRLYLKEAEVCATFEVITMMGLQY